MASTDNINWNIFARVLERALRAHGYTFWHMKTAANIHTQKISRLQRSLREPRFNVLSPAVLAKVETACNFTPDEVLQVRAAVLATAIEKMLMDRIDSKDALAAAEQVYPLLLSALKKQDDGSGGLSEAKGGLEQPLTPPPSPVQESLLDPTIDEIDAGTLLLYLADTNAGANGRQYAKYASMQFLAIRSVLEGMNAETRASEDWSVWHTEALSGLAHAEQRLAKPVA